MPESDDPIYIYVKMNQYPDIVKIELGADTGRPLIICIDAQASVGKPKVHVELNGHTFKGVIYNPYANLWEGTHINCNNSKFIGTVVCPKIEVQGGNGQFIYKDFMKIIIQMAVLDLAQVQVSQKIVPYGWFLLRRD